MNVRPKRERRGVKHEFHVGPADLTDTRMQKEMEFQRKLLKLIQEILSLVKEIHQEVVHYKICFHTEPKTEENITVKANGSSEQYHDQKRNVIEKKRESFDERVCLANALQFHVESLVDGIVFNESELPDCLLAEGCLTEDEYARVRTLWDRKDQIRMLLCLIKGRDLPILKSFVKHIKNYNRLVAAQIQDKFEDNMIKAVKNNLCSLCKLEKQFDVKNVADSLWANELIDDGLYQDIIHSESPVGKQNEIWSIILQTLNDLDEQKAELANEKLLTTIRSNNLVTQLADGVQRMLINNHGKLVCSCQQHHVDSLSRAPTSNTSYRPDSSSNERHNYSAGSFETQYRRSTMEDKVEKLTKELALFSRNVFQDKDYGYIDVSGKSDLNYQTFEKTEVSAAGDSNHAVANTTQYGKRANPCPKINKRKVTTV